MSDQNELFPEVAERAERLRANREAMDRVLIAKWRGTYWGDVWPESYAEQVEFARDLEGCAAVLHGVTA